nr:hypothetical protein CFP56_18155 [Quercus suber]
MTLLILPSCPPDRLKEEEEEEPTDEASDQPSKKIYRAERFSVSLQLSDSSNRLRFVEIFVNYNTWGNL